MTLGRFRTLGRVPADPLYMMAVSSAKRRFRFRWPAPGCFRRAVNVLSLAALAATSQAVSLTGAGLVICFGFFATIGVFAFRMNSRVERSQRVHSAPPKKP